MYPLTRLRRNRNHAALRHALAESKLKVEHLILPLFIVEGEGVIKPIQNFAGVSHYSIDTAIFAIKNAHENFGLNIFALFPVIGVSAKSAMAEESYNQDNLLCRAIQKIKNSVPDVLLITDVALDPYTISGHDGILRNNQVCNDETVEILCKQALAQAQAGSDIIAPSDMMDGRVLRIRQILDKNDFQDVCILSYAAKYNTKLYFPFRNAMQVQKKDSIDKSTYQLDLANSDEAMREIEEDIKEGADIVMVKPATICLDIIYRARQRFDMPIFAYHVSGEYFLLKNASSVPDFQTDQMLYEQLLSIRRAGAQCIITYGALEIAKFLTGSHYDY